MKKKLIAAFACIVLSSMGFVCLKCKETKDVCEALQFHNVDIKKMTDGSYVEEKAEEILDVMIKENRLDVEAVSGQPSAVVPSGRQVKRHCYQRKKDYRFRDREIYGFFLFFISEKWYHSESGNEESYGTETC